MLLPKDPLEVAITQKVQERGERRELQCQKRCLGKDGAIGFYNRRVIYFKKMKPKLELKLTLLVPPGGSVKSFQVQLCYFA